MRWQPNERVKIRIRDLPSAVSLIRYPPITCPACEGVRWDYRGPCRLCLGVGRLAMSPTVVPLARPRSRTVVIGRWRDPATGIVHARLLSKPQRYMRPSCGNNGMRATLTIADLNYTDQITCDTCFGIVERRLLRDAGDSSLPR